MRHNPFRMLPFLTLALGIWGGMNYYVFARLILAPDLPDTVRQVLTALLVLAALSVVPAFSRKLPHPVAGWVHLGAFGWMGAVFLIDTLLAGGDLLRTLLGLTPATLGPEALRTQAFLTAPVGLAVIGYAVRNARREPSLRPVDIRPHRWPEALDGLTIVQLSDVHVAPDTEPAEIRRLVDRVNGLSPDLVVLTGDLVDGPPHLLQDGVAPLGALRARLGVYAVTGNHEYYSGGDAWIAEFRRLGFHVLQNACVSIRAGEGAFNLAGVPDWRGGDFGADHRPRLADTLTGVDPDTPTILLAHQPRQFAEAASLGVSLQLSGHTHGGQIWPFTLIVSLFERYLAGLHRDGQSLLYVSRGTRYWGPPMRIGAPHELTLLTLRGPREADPLAGMAALGHSPVISPSPYGPQP